MTHPEGRLLAIQQQMFFAQQLAEKMDVETEFILRKLAMSGLALTPDVNEIAIDSAVILPKIPEWRSKLRLVPDVTE